MNQPTTFSPPSKLPPGWHIDEVRDDGARWINVKRKLSVIVSIAVEQDGQTWVHASIAHPSRMPTYDDLAYLKHHWLGEDRKAIMILPPKAEHVNIHNFALHLFCCLGADPLPDFTHGMRTI